MRTAHFNINLGGSAQGVYPRGGTPSQDPEADTTPDPEVDTPAHCTLGNTPPCEQNDRQV